MSRMNKTMRKGKEAMQEWESRGATKTVKQIAVRIAGKKKPVENEEYLALYTCCPPPFFIILVSLAQFIVFIYHQIIDMKGARIVESILIFDPNKKEEFWRFLTYFMVQFDFGRLMFYTTVQLLLGVPLELVHNWWRVMIIYIFGILSASLTMGSMEDYQHSYLCGAIGGVYAIIFAHLANIIQNWGEMEHPIIRIIVFFILIATNIGISFYKRSMSGNTVGFRPMVAGAVTGLLLGIIVLKNLKESKWEQTLWNICIGIFSLLALGFLGRNIWVILNPAIPDNIALRDSIQ